MKILTTMKKSVVIALMAGCLLGSVNSFAYWHHYHYHYHYHYWHRR